MKTKQNISTAQQHLARQFISLRDTKGINQATLARMVRCSAGTLSDIIGGKKVFSERLINILSERIKVYVSEGMEAHIVKEVRQYKHVMNITKSAHREALFTLMVGDTGLGKSIALKQYAKTHKRTFYIKIERRLTWNQLLTTIAAEMGLLEAQGKKREVKRVRSTQLMDSIIRYVEAENEVPCLIIDEAEELSMSVLRQFKNLYTATQDLLAIILCGITALKNKIAKLAGLNKEWLPIHEESNEYTTFARRLKRFVIPTINLQDMNVYCHSKGIQNPAIIDLATACWWNYEKAHFAIQRAKAMGIDTSKMTKEEWALIQE